MDEEYKRFIEEKLGGVKARIREKALARSADGAFASEEVTLLAATKGVDAEAINYAHKELGLTYIGENKAQELVLKYPQLDKEGLHVHFIGHLQTNKVRQIIDKVEMIHSLDSIGLAEEINKRAGAIGKRMPVLVEINIAREPEKGGVFPENAEDFIRQVSRLAWIHVKGLMTMAPAGCSESEYTRYFTEVRTLYERIRALGIPEVSAEVLSMGMSDSYECAVSCGATLVRVGSAIFGKRAYQIQN